VRIRWSPEAADDLERIYLRILENNRESADHAVRAIYAGCTNLKRFPSRGRIGREPDSRELIFSPLPWIAVYRIKGDLIEISRIWHGAQNRH
jgi:toxin ParE1/3/4